MPIDYNRVTFGGSVPGGDMWRSSCAFNTNFGTGPVKDYADLLAWANAIAALPSAGYSALIDAASQLGKPTMVRLVYIDSTGVEAQVAEASLSWADATSTPVQAPQCSIVCSLLTGRPGRSYRGRMYWPAWGAGLSATTLQLAASTATSIATNMGSLLSAVGNAAGTDFAMVPVVFSKVQGTTSNVSAVSVDTVVDTQRRRRNKIVGAPEVVPLS